MVARVCRWWARWWPVRFDFSVKKSGKSLRLEFAVEWRGCTSNFRSVDRHGAMVSITHKPAVWFQDFWSSRKQSDVLIHTYVHIFVGVYLICILIGINRNMCVCVIVPNDYLIHFYPWFSLKLAPSHQKYSSLVWDSGRRTCTNWWFFSGRATVSSSWVKLKSSKVLTLVDQPREWRDRDKLIHGYLLMTLMVTIG